MSKVQRNLTIALWTLMVVAMLSLVASGMLRARQHAHRQELIAQSMAHNPKDLDVYYPIPEFSLTDQNGKTVTLHDLKGKVWVGDFVFTRCAGICLTMSTHMSEIQKHLGPAGVKLVSFSVDPTYDTSEVLKKYAGGYGANEDWWTFLTGDPETIFAIARGTKLATEPAKEDSPILHSPMFVLVDKKGMIRGFYDSSDAERMEKLKVDAVKLVGE